MVSIMEASSTTRRSHFRGVFIVFLEASLLNTVLQQAVNGLGLVAGGLAHSLSGPARGSRQQKFDPGFGKDFEDGIDDGGFAGPRPPGNHHHLVGEGTLHCFHLPGCQGDVELLLHPGKGLVRVDGPDGLGGSYQGLQPGGNIGFAQMKLSQVDCPVATLGVPVLLKVLQDNLLLGPQGIQGPEEYLLVYLQDFLALCQERV